MKDAAAILDVGKTNLKLLVVDAELRPLARETTATPSVTGPPYRHLDAESIWDWVVATLEKLNRETPVSAIVPTAFGSTAALVNGDALVLPIMDYESVPPPHIAAEYESLAPPFEEVCAPVNPAGLTLARQLLWQSREFPTEFKRCTSILPFPQYWAWRLSGVRAAEVSSLGAQTHLWNPHRSDYSSLARNQGWAKRMPSSRKAWDTLGKLRPELAAHTGVSPECRILCGVHDSNANYVRFLKAGLGDFTLLSTGTWLIGFNGGYAIERLSPDRDTVSNSDVYDRAVACCRFMLGREHALLQDDATGTVRATTNEVGALVAGGTYAMPSFTESGGPFPTTGGRGTFEGPPPRTPAMRAALAALYGALMTRESVGLIDTGNCLVVDGGFASNSLYCELLAALFPRRRVLVSEESEGTALGAALLWLEGLRLEPPQVPLRQVPVAAISGLSEYAEEWRRRAYAHAGIPNTQLAASERFSG